MSVTPSRSQQYQESGVVPVWRAGKAQEKGRWFSKWFCHQSVFVHLSAQLYRPRSGWVTGYQVQSQPASLLQGFLPSLCSVSCARPLARDSCPHRRWHFCPGQWLVLLWQPPESSGMERGCHGGLLMRTRGHWIPFCNIWFQLECCWLWEEDPDNGLFSRQMKTRSFRMRIFGSATAAVNITAFLFHQERFWLCQLLVCPVGVRGSRGAAHFHPAATFAA